VQVPRADNPDNRLDCRLLEAPIKLDNTLFELFMNCSFDEIRLKITRSGFV